jgi:hypothetical protein
MPCSGGFHLNRAGLKSGLPDNLYFQRTVAGVGLDLLSIAFVWQAKAPDKAAGDPRIIC